VSKASLDLQDALVDAVSEGDVDRAEALLRGGATANGQSRDPFSALWHAATNGKIDTVLLLIRYGAKVGHENHKAVGGAAQYGQIEVLEALLHVDSSQSALRAAGFGLCRPVVWSEPILTAYFEHLVQLGLQVEQPDDDAMVMLEIAASRGHVGIMKAIVNAGYDVTQAVDALRVATREGQIEAVRFLVEHGHNIEADQGAPLVAAVDAARAARDAYKGGDGNWDADGKCRAMVEALLLCGADPSNRTCKAARLAAHGGLHDILGGRWITRNTIGALGEPGDHEADGKSLREIARNADSSLAVAYIDAFVQAQLLATAHPQAGPDQTRAVRL